MSELLWAEISIGGDLKKSLLKDLKKLLMDEELLLDSYGVYPIKEDDLKNYDILSNKDKNNLLTFESNETSNGEFKNLERWLQKHKIPYIRYCDSDGGDISHQTYIYTPDRNDPLIILNNSEQGHMIHVEEIKYILTAMETVGSMIEAPKFLSHSNDHEKAYAKYLLKEGKLNPIGYLREHIKERYTDPTLPEFKIIN